MAKTKFLRGDEARSLLEKQISEHNNGLLSALANYQASNAVRVWHDTIRAIEEFVNILLVDLDDEALIGWLASIPLDDRFLRDPGSVWHAVGRALEPHFERGTIERFCRLMIQIAAIGSGSRQHGQVDFGAGISLRTVGDASMVNQKYADLRIPNRFNLNSSRF